MASLTQNIFCDFWKAVSHGHNLNLSIIFSPGTEKSYILKKFKPEYFNFEKDMDVNMTIHTKAYKPIGKTDSNNESEETSASEESEEEEGK